MVQVYLAEIEIDRDELAARKVAEHHRRLRDLAARARHHVLVDDPAAAEVILFYVGPGREFLGGTDLSRRGLRRHPLTRRYPDRSFVFDVRDEALPFLPGVFTSIDRQFYRPGRQRAGFYLEPIWNPLLEPRGEVAQAEHLFSFLGAFKTPTRRALGELRHSRGLVVDTTRKRPRIKDEIDEPAEVTEPVESVASADDPSASYRQRFAESLHNSKFILCPSGRGTSSYRLFEAMRAGRAPVILADDWVEPVGPDWSSFSVRVPEAQVHRLPELLEGREPEAPELGRRAREAWEQWFSEQAAFDRIIEWCLELKRRRTPSGSAAAGRLAVWWDYLRWCHRRRRRRRESRITPAPDV